MPRPRARSRRTTAKALDFGAGSAAVGSSKMTHAGGTGQCARDLDHLLVRDAERPNRRHARREIRRALRSSALGHRAHGGAPHEQPALFPAQEHVLGDVQVRYQRELLVDDADAGVAKPQRHHRRAGACRSSCELATIRRDGPAQDLDECGFAGAVLADQRVDSPRREPRDRRHAGRVTPPYDFPSPRPARRLTSPQRASRHPPRLRARTRRQAPARP